MPCPAPLSQQPCRRLAGALALSAALALPALTPAAIAQTAAQTAEPTSTTATYGNWTVRCATSQPPAGDSQPPVRVCEMTTRLTLKGNDGQTRPLLQVAIGQPPGADTVRIVLQLPLDVALRQPVTVSLDQPGDTAQPVPQQPLLQASYLSCSARGCLAEADIAAALIDTLKGAATMNVGFTSLNGAQRIMVPVPLAGFAEAGAALGLADR